LLDHCCSWSIRFYNIVASRRPLASFEPGHVVVSAFGPEEPMNFWMVGDDRFGRAARTAKPPSEDGADEEEDDGEGVEDEPRPTAADEQGCDGDADDLGSASEATGFRM